MSTMIEPPRPSTPARETSGGGLQPVRLPDGRPNVALLEDQLPSFLKAPKTLAVLTAVLGVVYFTLNRLALRNSDVWGHLAYGRWIQSHGRLPETEPLLTLAQGVPWIDTAWLSKLGGAWLYERFGVAGLQMAHAVPLTLALVVLAWLMYRKTSSLGWTLLGLLALGVVNFQQLQIQRPQDFGVLAYVLVLAWGLNARDRRWTWVGLPVLFALWANLHGSWVVGLMTLAAIAAGRAIDIWRRTGNLRTALRSAFVWRAVLMTQLCAAAVLCNPVGLKIYADALTIATNSNVEVLFDWRPLTLRTGQGQCFALVLVLIGILYRVSPRRASATEVLLLLGTAMASLWSLRMLVWFGPVAAYCLAGHGAAAWRVRTHAPLLPAPVERRGIWTVATIGLCWIFFAYTPFGLQRLHGRPQGEAAAEDLRHSVVERTPLDAVEYLQAHEAELPAGIMYNSQEWGDYLQWAGPAKFPVFVNSHVHQIPEEVWNDYLSLVDGGGNVPLMLDRYGVTSVLVDTTNYMGLIRTLRDDTEWKEVFSDPAGMAVLFVRKRPI
jgi:hypothetical protein